MRADGAWLSSLSDSGEAGLYFNGPQCWWNGARDADCVRHTGRPVKQTRCPQTIGSQKPVAQPRGGQSPEPLFIGDPDHGRQEVSPLLHAPSCRIPEGEAQDAAGPVDQE